MIPASLHMFFKKIPHHIFPKYLSMVPITKFLKRFIWALPQTIYIFIQLRYIQLICPYGAMSVTWLLIHCTLGHITVANRVTLMVFCFFTIGMLQISPTCGIALDYEGSGCHIPIPFTSPTTKMKGDTEPHKTLESNRIASSNNSGCLKSLSR